LTTAVREKEKLRTRWKPCLKLLIPPTR
jgi:hypothetical protein